MLMLELLLGWQDPRVALFDATNTTVARRATLLARNRKEKNVTMVFVESICDDVEILQRNYQMKLQNNGESSSGDPRRRLFARGC